MARNKAIFDADILIHMVKTGSFDCLISIFEEIYVSDYVWNVEIKDGTDEHRILTKLRNKGFIKVLEYNKLADKQQVIYRDTDSKLRIKGLDNINEGERRTASFAKAYSVAWTVY